MRVTGLLLALLVTIASRPQIPQDLANGSIEGIIVDSANSPIDDVRIRVVLREGSPYAPSDYPDLPVVLTGPNGRFVITGLKAAVYGLVLEKNGYVRRLIGITRYGSELPEAPAISLVPSQSVKGITLRMTRTGTVTGRIREADRRQPVAGVSVKLMRLEYDADGERAVRSVDSVQTNDRGEYRLYFVTPGRYYISAGGEVPRSSSIPTATANEIRNDYAATFYPGVVDTRNATVIEVKPDGQLSGIDFLVNKQVSYRIRGRVVDTTTGQPPPSFTVTLYRRADIDWERLEVSSNTSYRTSDGTFAVAGLVRGSYAVVVNARTAAPRSLQFFPPTTRPRVISVVYQVSPSRPVGQEPGYASKATMVDIVDSDLEGLTISVSPGVAVDGAVSVEGRAKPALDRFQVSMVSSDRLLSSFSRILGTNAAEEGILRFADLAIGEYHLRVRGVPAGFYVKEARFGGVNVLHRELQVTAQTAGRIEMLISPNVAALEGIIRNDRRDPVAGSAVVLIPDQRDRRELFQRVTADSDGRFNFGSVAPGNYKIFAWESLESYAYFDAELIRRLEQRGNVIQLEESAKQNVELMVIPAN